MGYHVLDIVLQFFGLPDHVSANFSYCYEEMEKQSLENLRNIAEGKEAEILEFIAGKISGKTDPRGYYDIGQRPGAVEPFVYIVAYVGQLHLSCRVKGTGPLFFCLVYFVPQFGGQLVVFVPHRRLQSLPQAQELHLLFRVQRRARRDLADVSRLAVVGLLYKRAKHFLKHLVIGRTAQRSFLLELSQCETAIGTDNLLLGRAGEFGVRRLRCKQVAEKLVYRDVTLYSYVLLDGALLANVDFRADPIGDLSQVNRRIIPATNLALHIKSIPTLRFQQASQSQTPVCGGSISTLLHYNKQEPFCNKSKRHKAETLPLLSC